MKTKEMVMIVIEKVPELNIPPHVLPLLMDLFFGDMHQAHIQKEQLLAHLTTCHSCRTALEVLLVIVKDYDQKNDASDTVSQELLEHFMQLDDEIETLEADRLEQLAVYAETVVKYGKKEAETRFPDIAIHLKLCQDCQSIVKSTIDFLKLEHTD